jgi:hypothetical protein
MPVSMIPIRTPAPRVRVCRQLCSTLVSCAALELVSRLGTSGLIDSTSGLAASSRSVAASAWTATPVTALLVRNSSRVLASLAPRSASTARVLPSAAALAALLADFAAALPLRSSLL